MSYADFITLLFAFFVVMYSLSRVDNKRLSQTAAAITLSQVYQFTCQRLLAANLRRDPKLLREAERVFAPVAEAFARAVERTPTGAVR